MKRTLVSSMPYSDTQKSQPLGWSSEYRDSELNLIYYNYRHYNPQDARWINRDPIGIQGGYNLYGFVSNKVSWILDILGTITYVQISVSFGHAWIRTGNLRKINKNDRSKRRHIKGFIPEAFGFYPATTDKVLTLAFTSTDGIWQSWHQMQMCHTRRERRMFKTTRRATEPFRLQFNICKL